MRDIVAVVVVAVAVVVVGGGRRVGFGSRVEERDSRDEIDKDSR